MSKQIGAIILGGSGYGAGELLRYLKFHPEVEVLSVVSSSNIGQMVENIHPSLLGFYPDMKFTQLNISPKVEDQSRVIFSSLPHGTSSKEISKILSLSSEVAIIDLSGDLRLKNEREHSRHYPDVSFNPELREQFQFSLPEITGEPVGRYISNPGCLATGGALALAPLISIAREGMLVVDAKTGTSGAGRTAQENFHHPRRHGNFEAYKMLAHRHEPEIRQAVGLTRESELLFVPHLLPTTRGIFVSVYGTFKENDWTTERLLAHFRKFYEGKRFVRFRSGSPSLQEVVGTNFCDLSVVVRGRQFVVLGALDNLGKGMVGQAIQNMNLIFNLPEDLGLDIPAMGVI